MNMTKRRSAAAVFCTALLGAPAAWASGAIAIGLPADVATGGVAVGYTWNYPSIGEAETAALQQCLSYMDAPDATRALCKIVSSFDKRCVAVSLDPNSGTEGFGWSVADTAQDASNAALQTCRDSDGSEHADACAVQALKCDGAN